jgi:hypothetical protein
MLNEHLCFIPRIEWIHIFEAASRALELARAEVGPSVVAVVMGRTTSTSVPA